MVEIEETEEFKILKSILNMQQTWQILAGRENIRVITGVKKGDQTTYLERET